MSNLRKALIVEDDAAVRRMIAGIFQRRGWESDESDSVDGGIAALEGKPDLVLVDIGLGKETGWPMIHKAAKTGRPVLVITGGSLDDDVRADAELLGASAVLGKPFTEREFWAAVNRALLRPI